MSGLDLNLNAAPKSQDNIKTDKLKSKVDVVLEDIGNWINEPNSKKSNLICLIYGVDGTSKTGIVMDYLASTGKKTLYLDVDGNSEGLWQAHHEDKDFIHIKNPIELTGKIDKKTGEVTADIDYIKTFFKTKLAILWIREHIDEYDAIVVDGISTLVFYAQQQMKLTKNLEEADGKIKYQYWNERTTRFINMIEFTRTLRNIDKFYVGHDEFIFKPGEKTVDMGQAGIQKVPNTNQMVTKTNRAMDQRIWTEIRQDKNNSKYFKTFAIIHKSRANPEALYNEYLILEKNKDGATWHSENIEQMFKDLKKQDKKEIKN